MPEVDQSDPSVHWKLEDDADGAWGARRELADAIRALQERCVTSTATAADLQAAARAIRTVTDSLSAGPTCAERFHDGTYGERARENIDRTALMGRSNPVAPPMRVHLDPEGRSICPITFTEVHQGAPGMAHGGWVANVLDQLAGHALVMSGRRGFTGKLVIRYLRPTPLHRELVCIGEVERVSGRTVNIALRIESGGARIVEGEALMVQMDPERAQQIIQGV